MIGKIIRELRIEKGVTQNDLANYLGLTPKMISFYELEERFPPHDIIVKLADYFDVSTDYLLGRSEIKNSEKLLRDNNLLNTLPQEHLKTAGTCKTDSPIVLSKLESNLLEMFRLLDDRDRTDIHDNIYCKYRRAYKDSTLYSPSNCNDITKNGTK